MNTLERHLIHRLRNALACRNHKNFESKIYAHYEIRHLIKDIRNERNGTNAAYRAIYQKRAIAFSRGVYR
jgi:hypothetical protein